MDKDDALQKKYDEEMRNIIEEARCILPGLQAVFGFQTIAVFNDRFTELETYAQVAHLLGLVLLIIAMAMLMTPAVYYRAQHGVSTIRMLNIARKTVRGALIPLASGLSLDMMTVVSLATDWTALSIAVAVASLLLFVGLWYLIPRRDPVRIAKPHP